MTRWMLVVVALGLTPVVWSDEPKKGAPSPEAAIKALTEAAKPGPEHQKLEPFVGSWAYTGKFWMDPSKPPIETTGTCERKWILGGRFVDEKVAGTGFDGKPGFEGCGVLGYDNAQKKFTMGWICTMGTGLQNSTGTCDASGKNFTFQSECYCPVRQKKVASRAEVHIENNDKIVMETYDLGDGKERKVMEIVAIRKK